MAGEGVSENDKINVKGLPDALATSDWGGSEWCEWNQVMTCSGQEWRDHDGNLIPVEDAPTVAEIIEVWWTSNGGGELSDDIGSELELYAVVRFTDDRLGYVEAWNDYTGWGCQDGVAWVVADTPEHLEFRMTDEGRARLKWRP